MNNFKKILVLTAIFSIFFIGLAYAEPAVTSNSTNFGDGLYKGAMALLLTALAALITSFVPMIAMKGNTASDTFFEYLKTKTKNISVFNKKEENERIGARLESLLNALDSAADSMFKIIGKVKVVRTEDNKIVVENLNDVSKEAHENILPRLTTSTKDMAAGLGLDLEEILKSFIKEKAGRVL